MSQVQNKLENFLADDQLTKTQITDLIALAISIKNHPIDYSQALAGKSVAMIFEKPSLRTHVSFDSRCASSCCPCHRLSLAPWRISWKES